MRIKGMSSFYFSLVDVQHDAHARFTKGHILSPNPTSTFRRFMTFHDIS